MKKMFVVLAILALLTSPAYAVQTQRTLIDKETINRDNYEVEASANISDAERVAFFVTYNSSSLTEGVTVNVTVSISIDGVNWTDVCWSDAAGGATLQTSETLSSSGIYAGWFDKSLTSPYVNIKVSMTEHAATNLYGPEESAEITVTLVEKK